MHFQVCGDGVRGCCVTPNLDHPFKNDWEAGRSYEFSGGDLEECNDFDLGDPANINLDFFMEIYHTGLEHFFTKRFKTIIKLTLTSI